MIQLSFARIAKGQGHEAGRALLEKLYLQQVGQAMPAIVKDPGGKPRFAEGALHFSISHTKGHVFCVLADKPVGVDAEEMDRQIDLRLAEKILSESEKRRFDGTADKRDALLRFWVLKEAAAKLTGEGLRGYPNHTDFDPADKRITEMNGSYVAVLTE